MDDGWIMNGWIDDVWTDKRMKKGLPVWPRKGRVHITSVMAIVLEGQKMLSLSVLPRRTSAAASCLALPLPSALPW